MLSFGERLTRKYLKKCFLDEKVYYNYRESGIVNNKTGEKTKIVPREGDMIFGVFIFVGYIPESTIFNGIIGTDRNYIVSDETMKTSVEGVFVAGDVRVKELRQVVTAVNDGAIAAINARKYVESLS